MKNQVKNILLCGVIAIAAHTTEAATKRSVTFESQGIVLAGDLYLPDNVPVNTALPAIVVSGSWTSVKEQMAGGYAQKMADKGYAALAFDFSGWGQSGGAPRFIENPARKTAEIIDAVAYLASLAEVDKTRIATLGICASAGYATDAALQSDLVKASAVVAPWYHDALIVEEVYAEHVPALLEASRLARSRFNQTGESTVVLAASNTDKTAIMQNAPYYTDPQQGLIPEYDNKFNLMTWEPWLTYDGIQSAGSLTKPTLLIHSEAAAIPQGAKKYLRIAGDNVTGVWLDNITQFAFYNDPQAMAQATALVDQHLRDAL